MGVCVTIGTASGGNGEHTRRRRGHDEANKDASTIDGWTMAG